MMIAASSAFETHASLGFFAAFSSAADAVTRNAAVQVPAMILDVLLILSSHLYAGAFVAVAVAVSKSRFLSTF